MSGELLVVDAGVMGYQAAWDLQLELHPRVLSGELATGALMLVEHPPVITIGRRQEAQRHLLASPAMLKLRGVELVETDRGGDITFHGPGQLVVYPILNLNAYGLNLHSYMRLLEDVVISVLAEFRIEGHRVDGATGVWVGKPEAGSKKSEDDLAKICAMGVKLRRWVTLHGLALNVSTDLTFFEMINPCGLSKPVTSMRAILGEQTPEMADVKSRIVDSFSQLLRHAARKNKTKQDAITDAHTNGTAAERS